VWQNHCSMAMACGRLVVRVLKAEQTKVNHEARNTIAFLAQDARERLEWPLFLEHLAQSATFEQTKADLLALVPDVLPEERERLFAATREMLELIAEGNAPSFRAVDFNSFLPILRRQGALSARSLYDVLVFLEQIEPLAHFAKPQHDSSARIRFAEIQKCVAVVVPLPKLRFRLAQSVAPDGSVLSSASPELRSARDRAENAKRQVVSVVENLLQKNSVRDALQDPVWVMRDGRVVLPVRVERRSDIDGIPRGVSGSGATVFVEPREIASAQAAFERAQADVEIEEARVLNALSQEAAAHFDDLEANCGVLLELDNYVARARMASVLQAQKPEFLDAEKSPVRFRLVRASHPLFLLEGKTCVPNDLSLEPQFVGDARKNVWVLTGPNAGGKTVAMRTVGMAVLMAKAGLFVCAEKAEIADFEHIFVELGDRQSREDDLSTFSGHLLHVSRIFSHATPRSLVLLDEGFVGTDPAVGMALARAALEDLCGRGVTTLITTHFSNLKTLANENAAFLNASMEFESKKLRPTYRLINGIPGQSFALELADRISFPQNILAMAREYYGDESHRVELLLAELQEKRSEIQKVANEHARELQKAKAERAAAEAEKNRIARERDELVQNYRSRLSRRLNAFENRLMVRERQFEKHLAASSALGSENEAPETDDVSPDLSLSPSEKQAAALEKEDLRKEKKTFSSLSDLQGLTLSAKAKSTSATEHSVDDVAAKFRAPRHMSSRSLLDEARGSLDFLDKDFDRIEDAFKKEMGKLAGATKPKAPPASQPLRAAEESKPERPASYWSRGMRVKTTRFRDAGTVLRAADNKGLVECEFGVLRLRIPHSELKTIDEAARETSPKPLSKPPKASLVPKRLASRGVNLEIAGVLPHGGNTVDVRGRTSDEGVEIAARFLDRAIRSGERHVVILHGHGEGKVKQAVRAWLQEGGYDISFRPGRQGEGGDGVTVVQLEE
jgi:DNA mismatch repair protein MutS2